MNASVMTGKVVAVTGAGGSIGSQICEALAPHVKCLVLVSLTESALYNLEKKLRLLPRRPEIASVLGSVLDKQLMRECFTSVDVVIHAAAHKHLPICEKNPLAAIENNVLGTYRALLAATMAKVKQFVFISTDKAVRPASVMGCTKRVGERIVSAFSRYSDTEHFVVRFGNVMDSAGSVLPLWREQIARGGPITITDRGCERFFMTIPDAVELILGVLAMKTEPGTYVFDMGAPRKLIDMANELIAAEATAFGRHIDINEIGLRPGEKLTEELHHGGDLIPTQHPRINQVDPSSQKELRLIELTTLFEAVERRETEIALHYLQGLAAE